MTATYEDADWTGTALLNKVVAGDLTQIVANFDIKTPQGCSRVVERAAANNDCVNSAIFASTALLHSTAEYLFMAPNT